MSAAYAIWLASKCVVYGLGGVALGLLGRKLRWQFYHVVICYLVLVVVLECVEPIVFPKP